MFYFFRHATKKLFSPKYLLVTNTITSGGLMALGDSIQQVRERRAAVLKAASTPHSGTVYQNVVPHTATKQWDWARTGRMLTIGLILGPLNHYWYAVLDRFLPGATGRTVAKKVFLDELIASPVFTTSFFVGVGLLEGKSLQESIVILKKKFLTVYMMDWCVWPAMQTFNFYMLPPHVRVIFVNFVSLAWDVFLSFMNHAHGAGH